MARSLALDDIIRLVPTTRAMVHERSRGAITRNPVAFDLNRRSDRWLAERGGFYDEQLFGPLDTPAADRIAHIDLPEAMPHPLWGGHVDTIVVVPATLRPFASNPDGTITVPILTVIYQDVYQTACTWRRLLELGAPSSNIDSYRVALANRMAMLFDNHFATPAATLRDGTRVDTLAALLETDALERFELVLFALGLQIERT